MLVVAQRLLDVVQRQAAAAADVPEEPPSLFALAGKLRDPEIRRGMGRALDTLSAVSTTSGAPKDARMGPHDDTHEHDTKGGA
jgi:uncharacterized protein YjgD (DUF1641 family)